MHGRPGDCRGVVSRSGGRRPRQFGYPKLHIPRWGRAGLVVEAQSDRGSGSDAVTRAFHRALDLVGPKDGTGVDVTIDGELPLGVGLGSSAAFSVRASFEVWQITAGCRFPMKRYVVMLMS